MNRLGERLAGGIVELARRAGLPACWSGVGSMFQVWFCDEEQLPWDYRSAVPILKSSLFRRFWQGLMERGVLVQPRQDNLFLLGAAHTEQDIETTLEVVQQVLQIIGKYQD